MTVVLKRRGNVGTQGDTKGEHEQRSLVWTQREGSLLQDEKRGL